MPGIPKFYEFGNKDIDSAADEERDKRIKKIQKARKYYEGDHDKPLKVDPMGDDDNIILNLAGQTIDKTTDFIGVPTFSTSAKDDDATEEILAEMVKAVDLPFLMPDLLTSGQIAGHAFVRIILPEEGEVSRDNLPTLAPLAPEYVTVFWDMGLYGMKRGALWYRLEWEFGRITRRQDIVPLDLIQDNKNFLNEIASVASTPRGTVEDTHWVILEYEKGRQDANGYSARDFELIAADFWAYPFPPIIDGKNRRKPHDYYGESDLRDLDLNDAVNFVVSNTAKIIKHHAHPKTILTGDDGSSLSGTKVDGLWAVPNELAQFKNLEMQSDLDSSMRLLDILRSSWFTQARVVDMTTQKEKVGQMTNFSVRMLFNDMIEMAGDKQLNYGRILETAFERMLFMLQIDADVLAHWADPLPTNRLEVVQTAEAEQSMGVSKETTFKDLGRDYEAELEKVAQESANEAMMGADRLLRAAQAGSLN